MYHLRFRGRLEFFTRAAACFEGFLAPLSPATRGAAIVPPSDGGGEKVVVKKGKLKWSSGASPLGKAPSRSSDPLVTVAASALPLRSATSPSAVQGSTDERPPMKRRRLQLCDDEEGIEEDASLALSRKTSSQYFSAPRGASDSPTTLEGNQGMEEGPDASLAAPSDKAIEVGSSSSDGEDLSADDLLTLNQLVDGMTGVQGVFTGEGSSAACDVPPISDVDFPASADLAPGAGEAVAAGEDVASVEGGGLPAGDDTAPEKDAVLPAGDGAGLTGLEELPVCGGGTPAIGMPGRLAKRPIEVLNPRYPVPNTERGTLPADILHSDFNPFVFMESVCTRSSKDHIDEMIAKIPRSLASETVKHNLEAARRTVVMFRQYEDSREQTRAAKAQLADSESKVASLEGQVANLSEERDRLLKESEGKVALLEGQVASLTEERNRLLKELEDARAAETPRMDELLKAKEEEHKKFIQELIDQYESSTNSLQMERSAAEDQWSVERMVTQTALQEIRAEREEFERKVSEDVASLKASFAAELYALHNEHSAAMQSLVDEHQRSLSRMATTHSMALGAMTKQLDDTLELERAQL